MFSVGAVPSGASARPNRAASFSWVFLRALYRMQKSQRLNLGGCAPPPPPRPLSLDRQRKGGKKARPWRRPQGFCLRRATPALPLSPHTGVVGVVRTGPRPKAPPPARSRQGQKTPRRPPRKKRTTTRTGSTWLKRSSRIRLTTTRHAASLRPPRHGRIDLKPPHSKRETAAKDP